MKKGLLILFVFSVHYGFSQPAIQWQNTIGGDSLDWLYSVQQTRDGGYILGGISRSNVSGDKTENNIGFFDYWIVKTDSLGVIQWQNTIGGNDDDLLRVVQQTPDGGYILGGSSFSNISGDKTENSQGGSDYWIVKTDSLGNIQWQNNIGGSLDDKLWSLDQTADGGYILAGESNSNASGDKTQGSAGIDYWILKVNSVGNILWQKTIGGSNDDELYSIQQTTDHGYILGGASRSNANGDKTEATHGFDDYWILKLDSVGNIVWQNDIGAGLSDELYSVRQTRDGGYILGGYSNSNIGNDKTQNSRGTFDYWIVKTNSTGVVQWDKTIGGDSVEFLYSARQTIDGGYILGGLSGSHATGDKTEDRMGGLDYWIIKTDSLGNIVWQNTIGGSLNEDCHMIRQTTDEGYIIAGSSYSGINGDKTESSQGLNDYWLVKINHELRAACVLQSNVLCHGNASGSAIAVGTGGAPPYTYSWSPSGGNGATASNLIAGTYTCEITDGGGGDWSATITITQPPLLTSSVTAQTTSLQCYGDRTIAWVVAGGGTGAYTYEWNTIPVQTNDTAFTLSGGNYTATVTDANGCISTDTVTIIEPPLLYASIIAHTNVTSCGNGNNGGAKAFASGGTGPLTYSWNTVPVQTAPTAMNLAVGNYTVTVTDAHGCTASASVTITQPSSLASAISAQTDILCFGGNNGSAVVTVSGGNSPFTYSWNTVPVQTTDTAINLVAGNYTVTVMDSDSCAVTSHVTITEPAPLTVSFSGNNISCYGGNNGTAAANVSGGTLPYTYLWSTGDTIQTLANLLPGTYTVGVTDSSGCYTEDSIIITQPSVILTDSLSSTAISCYGGGDGSATAIPSGGVQPYFYSWSNGDTTSTATNLLAATYSVSITDSAGCTIIDTVSLTEPTQLISTTSVVSPACGNSNGSATVTVVGGTLPYTYSWSSGDTTSTVSGLTGAPTDTLTVLITDANNCTDTAVAIVDCSTGTGNISSHNKIIIIPNPAHDYFTIAFSGQLPVDNGQVKIFDMTGRLVHEQQIHSQLSTVNCQLSSGVYFVKVYNGEKVYAQKLVIE